ncbi:MAG: TMEM165/GDT1 family protein [Alphaproteobacteria bacterium]|nr:TMEM165/GDT1 family protein [Alphaproteobacteria bacterium]
MTPVEVFVVSAATGAMAEFGDKTQLVAALLAVRLKRPWAILGGLLVATLTHRLAAGMIGAILSNIVGQQMLQSAVGLAFVGLALWVLAASEESLMPIAADEWVEKLGPFMAAAAAFFLAEIGDKTQIATLALVARTDMPLVVSAGTTLGLLLVSVPVLLLGRAIGGRLQMRVANLTLAIVLAVMGVMTFMGITGWR